MTSARVRLPRRAATAAALAALALAVLAHPDLRVVAVLASPAWLPLLAVPRATRWARRAAARRHGAAGTALALVVIVATIQAVTLLALGVLAAVARYGLFGAPAGQVDADAFLWIGLRFAALNTVGVLPWAALAWWAQGRPRPTSAPAPGPARRYHRGETWDAARR